MSVLTLVSAPLAEAKVPSPLLTEDLQPCLSLDPPPPPHHQGPSPHLLVSKSIPPPWVLEGIGSVLSLMAV